jgi:type VI protein secretion system component VasF
VAGYLSKLLFPRASHSQRRRRMRSLWFWLVASIFIVGLVAGLFYLLWRQATI